MRHRRHRWPPGERAAYSRAICLATRYAVSKLQRIIIEVYRTPPESSQAGGQHRIRLEFHGLARANVAATEDARTPAACLRPSARTVHVSGDVEPHGCCFG